MKPFLAKERQEKNTIRLAVMKALLSLHLEFAFVHTVESCYFVVVRTTMIRTH